MPQNTKSQENHYGGTRRHHPEHDSKILENFTDDNQDFLPNSAQYNDPEEIRFNTEDRLAHEHHDRPEQVYGSDDFRPSIYSDGGHGRQVTKPPVGENSDNKDYVMNKDSEQGAQQKYHNTEAKTRRHWWSFLRK
ncbi:hypothetical protein AZI86_17250 [Bdellovibrio bacteriovorus]|uniref:Uncharacterized protein n=1 Tax=Bdellovibrio bacteriovorus TaxID=959 RepID=A0A150WEK7_BDEBC|nr:hypothetical protein [Bdellovibrio bacteriovorus]KYG61459.1 hypothetical protein AZI86_17250 [Bdellovibrio bacteriovorus]